MVQRKTTAELKLSAIKKIGLRAKGKRELIKYLKDNLPLSARESIYAKCYDCAGYYIDGVVNCNMVCCPLYSYMPYNTNKIKRVRKKASKTKV